MSERDRKRLKEIQTFPALVKYLREDLGWPVEQGSFDDMDEITFDWEADELGIDPDQAAKIEYIKQLRPLENGQPQGVFFVKFNNKNLPVVALRRLLGKLVVKKRATAAAAERPLWAMRDLVFISSYGESDERQLSFAYFQEPEHKSELPSLRVLGWDDRDTALHLDRVHDQLAAHLTWPESAKALPTWRKGWSAAFELRHGEIVTTAKQLAEQLAALARGIRERANQLLKLETENGPLRTLMAGFKTALIHDLTEDQFADMYAQTIAYGLLSARITHPDPVKDPVKAETLPDLIPVTNPFLKELMETFVLAGGKHRGRKKGHHLDFDELGINEVVELLRRANMDAVLRNFGADDRREDPVTYFYEDFLNAYDAKERKRRGVYYTPKPVVSYIVRSVHELLQTEFGIEDGLASTITWGEMAKQHKDLKIPQGVAADSPFVQILDPATGTATFLVTVIEIIFDTLTARWKKEGLSEAKRLDAWNEYVPKHLLPRLYGYELMMAPYAIAHLKIGLSLFATGYRFESTERARIYLTNALERASDGSYSQVDALSEALAHESEAVNRVKGRETFTVVLGNPPYAQMSANLTSAAIALVEPYRYLDGVRIVEKSALSLERNLNDDYVKFLRLAEEQIEGSAGIVGMITSSAYLDAITLRGVRGHLLSTYERIYCLDLHGDADKRDTAADGSTDDNVFEIKKGVAISLQIRTARPRARLAPIGTVLLSELRGSIASKERWLTTHDVTDAPWAALVPRSPKYLFVMQSDSLLEEYDNGMSITDIFPEGATGFTSGFDELLTGFSKTELVEKLADFASLPAADVREHYSVTGVFAKKIFERRRLLQSESVAAKTARFLFAPFDTRVCYYEPSMLMTASFRVGHHLLDASNIALIVMRQVSIGHGFSHAFVTRDIPNNRAFYSTKGKAAFFPAYLVEDEAGLRLGGGSQVGNLSGAASRRMDTMFPGKCDEVTPESVMAYCYAVLHSNAYRSRYDALLRSEYPRILIADSPILAEKLRLLGSDLIALHLLEADTRTEGIAQYDGGAGPHVGAIAWHEGSVVLESLESVRSRNRGGAAARFRNVSKDIWEFRVGGYQVCEKWLKDRKGRKLLKADIEHYQKIVVAISETIRIMKEIDEIIDQHGGWPGAFKTGEEAGKKGH